MLFGVIGLSPLGTSLGGPLTEPCVQIGAPGTLLEKSRLQPIIWGLDRSFVDIDFFMHNKHYFDMQIR